MTSRETVNHYEALHSQSDSSIQLSGTHKPGCCSGKKKIFVYLTIGLILLMCGGTLFFIADNTIQNMIDDKLALSKGSEIYSMWLQPDIPIYMQFFTFDCINHLEVLKGAKPAVVQRGPYSYREYRKKHNITWFGNNNTVLYNELHTYVFDPATSCAGCNESDQFTNINIPYMTIVQLLIQKSKELPPSIVDPVLKVLSDLMEVNEYGLFTTRSVKDIAFGYTDPVLAELSYLLSKLGIHINPFFGLQQNPSDIGMTAVHTGKDDIDNLLETVSWEGQTLLDKWHSQYANMLNGSDGSQFKPGLTEKDTLYVFVTMIFRSLSLTYDSSESVKGIDGLRFSVPPTELQSGDVNPDNEAFCPASGCLPTGLLDLSCCVPMNAPVVVSAPHFFQGDPKIIDSVYGMDPIEEEHGSFLTVEPHLGVPLLAHKRLQINIHVQKFKDFADTENLANVFFPLLYVNESTRVDEPNAEKIKNSVVIILNVTHGLEIGLVSVGGILLLVALVLVLRRTAQDHEEMRKAKTILQNGHNSDKAPLVGNGSAAT